MMGVTQRKMKEHEIHSTREFADLQEMEVAYNLLLEIIKRIPTLRGCY